jgi:hypothetical protein
MASIVPLDSMSDAALWQRCQLRAWERGLERIGCLAFPVLIVTCLVAGQWWLARAIGADVSPRFRLSLALLALIPLMFLALLAGLAVFTVCHGLAYQRVRASVNELQRRWGQGRFADYVAACHADLDAEAGPDRIVLLQGIAEEGICWIRLTWRGAAVSMSLRNAPRIPHQLPSMTSPDQAECIDIDMSSDQCQEVLAVLDQIGQQPLADARRHDHDGLLCNLALLQRQPASVSQAYCVLGSHSAEALVQPTTALARAVLKCAAPYSSQKLLLGWAH